MQRYIFRRLVTAVPTIFGITILIFVAMRILPGDPLAVVANEGQGQYRLTDEELTAARASLGLDRPLPEQYLNWMADVARGDLGHSFWNTEPIRQTVAHRGLVSLEIALAAVALSWLIGVPAGILSGTHRNSWSDYVVRLFMPVFLAIPSFWIGLTTVLVLVLTFTWRPPLVITELWQDPLTNLQMIVGPAIALGIGLAAGLARMTRSTILEALFDAYVRTARSKGLRENAVVGRHVKRNALVPVVTTAGAALSALMGAAV